MSKRLPSDAFQYCPFGGRCSYKCKWALPKFANGKRTDPDCAYLVSIINIARYANQLEEVNINLLNIVGAIRGER